MSPGIQIVAQEVTIDQELNSMGESSNETVPDATVEPEIEQIRVTSPLIDDAVLQTSNVISSYAAMADPDEGTSLNFVHSQIVNGVKCAKIKPQDVQYEIEYWNSAVLCSVLGENPPLEVIEGLIRRIWQAFAINKIYLVRKGVFLVRFKNISDQSTVVQRGNEEMDINIETLVTLPVWVRFPKLDIKYWGVKSLSKIGSVLGDNFPDFIDFVNEHNVVVRQKVKYEWKPTKCNYCKMFGHTGEECRKKPLPRAEWRPIIRQGTPLSTPTQLTTDAKGFVQVRKKAVASVYKE
ncbi:hypothetical protein Cgig2_021475 [Carnegiea gigantea]|uniref:DUF4283 domain-containing protein n=1 Tax=Carnegiea gigantea TaxID=171969 RepID=A0A9Q1GTI7_9CARY|nr:hypothetical protein Cgig2_021475 [Carnegiea gigantea]